MVVIFVTNVIWGDTCNYFFSKGRGKGIEDAFKSGFGGFIDFQLAMGGHSELNSDNMIAIESITLDYLRGTLKHGDTKLRKERVLEFFKSNSDVCKPTPYFQKKFTIHQKKAGPFVPLQRDVFATFSPFHLAVMFLKDMNDLADKRRLVDILKQRMVEDKEFARDAFFTEVNNEGLFNQVTSALVFSLNNLIKNCSRPLTHCRSTLTCQTKHLTFPDSTLRWAFVKLSFNQIVWRWNITKNSWPLWWRRLRNMAS